LQPGLSVLPEGLSQPNPGCLTPGEALPTGLCLVGSRPRRSARPAAGACALSGEERAQDTAQLPQVLHLGEQEVWATRASHDEDQRGTLDGGGGEGGVHDRPGFGDPVLLLGVEYAGLEHWRGVQLLTVVLRRRARGGDAVGAG